MIKSGCYSSSRVSDVPSMVVVLLLLMNGIVCISTWRVAERLVCVSVCNVGQYFNIPSN